MGFAQHKQPESITSKGCRKSVCICLSATLLLPNNCCYICDTAPETPESATSKIARSFISASSFMCLPIFKAVSMARGSPDFFLKVLSLALALSIHNKH
jgi:hypothetical protein